MFFQNQAAIAQLGERQTEDLKVPGSIPGLGMLHVCLCKCITSKITKLQASTQEVMSPKIASCARHWRPYVDAPGYIIEVGQAYAVKVA